MLLSLVRHTALSLKPAFPKPILGTALCSICLLSALTAFGQEEVQRPRAADLLPERTGVYVQIENFQELVADMKASNFGQMLQDERIRPLVEELYGQALNAYEQVEEDVGVSFEELLELPRREICFAVVTPRREEPKLALFMDVPEDSDVAQRLIDRGLVEAREDAEDDEDRSVEVETDDSQGIEYNIVRGLDDPAYYVLHEGTFVGTTDEILMQEILVRWQGLQTEDDRSLSENRKFITIMNKCRSTEELPMAFSMYLDPIMLARSITANQASTRIFFGALPILGLDGLNAIGGAALFNEKGYESIFHMHVLLANPRAGILEMIAMKPGFYDPESFVPSDAAAYATSNWDVPKFMTELEKIVDMFTNEGYFQEQIETNINEELEINFQEDVIDNLQGRFSYIQWIGDVRTFDAASNALVIQFKDQEKGKQLIEALFERIAEAGEDSPMIEEDYGGITYWAMDNSLEGMQRDARRRFRARREGVEPDELEADDEPELEMIETTPCFCFIDDHFILAGNVKLLEHMIDTHNGDHDKLVDNPDYDQVVREMESLLDGNLPSVMAYSQPVESVRLFYELAQTENTREFLDRIGEESEFVRGLKDTMDENPLPPFDEFAPYFPPQGSFVVNDETGWHLLTFQRKAEIEDND